MRPPAPLVVTTEIDEVQTPSGGKLSLREAIRDSENGGRILFTPTLSGVTLNLISELAIGKSLFLDASDLPRGIMLRGAGDHRLMRIDTPAKGVSIHAISFRDGSSTDNGGAIRSTGVNLTMSRSAIFDNSATGDGGALHLQAGSGLFENVTLSGNQSGGAGGAINTIANRKLSLRYCTVVENTSALTPAGLGLATATGFVHHCILARNIRAGTNLENVSPGSFISDGTNLLDSAALRTGDIVVPDPLLLPITDTGGQAWAHPPDVNSAIVDAGFYVDNAPPFTDSRGGERKYGIARDIGAFELGAYLVDSDKDGMDDFWEIYYELDPDNFGDRTLNPDGDSANNLAEFQNGTNPNVANSPLGVIEIVNFTAPSGPGGVALEFTSQPGIAYEIWRSDDLMNWNSPLTIYGTRVSNTSTAFLERNPATPAGDQFFRVQLAE